MNKKGYTSILKDNKGAALIISLFIMLLLTLIGAAALMTSSTETKISGNVMTSKKAFYAAEAGLERFKAKYMNDDWSVWTDGTTIYDGIALPGDNGDNGSYTVTKVGGAMSADTITINSTGTFSGSSTTIEARFDFDKSAIDKTIIDDTNGTIKLH
jgi:hypothetical protein